MRTDRIDFSISGGKVLVVKFKHVAGIADQPHGEAYELDRSLQEALDWCKANHYTIYEWPGGARAFRGYTPWPIRSRKAMQRLRDRMEAEANAAMRSDPGTWHEAESLLSFDLAYCF